MRHGPHLACELQPVEGTSHASMATNSPLLPTVRASRTVRLTAPPPTAAAAASTMGSRPSLDFRCCSAKKSSQLAAARPDAPLGLNSWGVQVSVRRCTMYNWVEQFRHKSIHLPRPPTCPSPCTTSQNHTKPVYNHSSHPPTLPPPSRHPANRRHRHRRPRWSSAARPAAPGRRKWRSSPRRLAEAPAEGEEGGGRLEAEGEWLRGVAQGLVAPKQTESYVFF